MVTVNEWTWLGLGLCIYFFYGRHHSVLTRVEAKAHMGGAGKRGGVEPVAGR